MSLDHSAILVAEDASLRLTSDLLSESEVSFLLWLTEPAMRDIIPPFRSIMERIPSEDQLHEISLFCRSSTAHMNTQQPMPMRRRALRTAQSILEVSGLAAALPRPGGAVILMYHSVAGAGKADFVDPALHMDPAIFDGQMRFLVNNRTVLSLDNLVQLVRDGVRPEPSECYC